jgi:hypothetical protein
LQVGAEWIAEIVGRIKNDDCAYFRGPGTDGAICRTSRLAAQQLWRHQSGGFIDVGLQAAE